MSETLKAQLINLSEVYTIKAGLQSNPREAAWCYAFAVELGALIEGLSQDPQESPREVTWHHAFSAEVNAAVYLEKHDQEDREDA